LLLSENIVVEAFLIMVGEVEFLQKPVIAFIRLMGQNFICRLKIYYFKINFFIKVKSNLIISFNLDDLDGFRVKIRYLFIFLGPKSHFSYLETGRCIGNLMNDKVNN